MRWRWLGLLPALPILLALAVVGINAFDSSLDPKAAATGEPRVTQVADAQNGYLAVIAMGAGDGSDGNAYALAWLAEARLAARENRPEQHVEAKRAQRPDLCDPAQTSCLTVVQDKADSLRARLDAYKEDLVRYEKLIDSRAYEEILDYRFSAESQFPRYAAMGGAQRAWLVRAALSAHEGNIDSALTAIERDIAFQRLMLQRSRTLIGRMIAAANYSRDLAFLADLLQTSLADLKPHAPRLTAMLQPIAPDALNMDVLIETEFGAMKQLLKDPGAANKGQSGWMESLGMRWLYQPNATVNAAFAQYMQARESLRRTPAALLLDQETQKNQDTAGDGAMPWQDYLVNPMGKILVKIGMPSFVSYALRLHDLDAMNRMLGLAAEIIAADVNAEDIEVYVAKSGAPFFDPYTGRPMRWDAAKKQLSFQVSPALGQRKFFNLENGRMVLQM